MTIRSRNASRSLRCETLEGRKLMAADLAVLDAVEFESVEINGASHFNVFGPESAGQYSDPVCVMARQLVEGTQVGSEGFVAPSQPTEGTQIGSLPRLNLDNADDIFKGTIVWETLSGVSACHNIESGTVLL